MCSRWNDPPIRKVNVRKTNTEKAVVFGEHLEVVSSPNRRKMSAEEQENIHDLLAQAHQTDLPIRKFSLSRN